MWSKWRQVVLTLGIQVIALATLTDPKIDDIILISSQRIRFMAQMLVRGLPDNVMARLKARAESHGRSVESEVRTILEAAAGFSIEQARNASAKWQAHFAGRQFADSSELLREDRDR
jgi:plasmid stability protein